jgi:uncharacterized protein
MDTTTRVLDAYAKVETRELSDGKMVIEGMIPFNSRSEEMWGFVEQIAPSAFNKTLADGANVYGFWAHDDKEILASRDAGTLTLSADVRGLNFSMVLREDCKSRFEAVKRGDVTGVSFGFIPRKQEWDETVEPALRTLTEVQLLEISPGVAFPAYPGAQSDAARRALYAEGAPEFRTKYIRKTEEPAAPAAPEADPLAATPEQPEALESRQRAELALLCATMGIEA